jgi:dihydroxy-acid dehydratase
VLKALTRRIALVTDGRFSGADSGLMIGYVTPEAASGGAIGIVQDGDEIEINLEQRTLTLNIPPAELQQRLKNFTPLYKESLSELLDCYKELVGPASEGAVWRVGG